MQQSGCSTDRATQNSGHGMLEWHRLGDAKPRGCTSPSRRHSAMSCGTKPTGFVPHGMAEWYRSGDAKPSVSVGVLDNSSNLVHGGAARLGPCGWGPWLVVPARPACAPDCVLPTVCSRLCSCLYSRLCSRLCFRLCSRLCSPCASDCLSLSFACASPCALACAPAGVSACSPALCSRSYFGVLRLCFRLVLPPPACSLSL